MTADTLYRSTSPVFGPQPAPAPQVIRHPRSPQASAGELVAWLGTLARVAGDKSPVTRVLRLGQPAPTVAFGRLDTRRPGYAAARVIAVRHGFEPVVRDVGGHAAAYDEGCLVVEIGGWQSDPREQTGARFEAFAELVTAALRQTGVDARVGEVPDEYCPGRFSVNARGSTKLAGLAQRVTTSGWVLSGIVTVRAPERVRAVVEDVYAALDLPLNPRTVGCVADELPVAPALSVDDLADILTTVIVSAALDEELPA